MPNKSAGSKVRRTPEERAEQAQALHDSIAAQVEELTNSDAWARYLEFVGSFHAYSLNNVMLILSQYPAASRVAGFRQWQAKGRQVRKGERGIKIFGYSTKKYTDTDPTTGEEVEKKRPRFPILSVFDIGQTDPIEGADEIPQIAARLSGDDPDQIAARVSGYLTGRGVEVRREPIAGEVNGYATKTDSGYLIVVHDDLAPAQAAKTLLHEAAHLILGHVDQPEEYVKHRGRMEVEAESTAYVVAGLLGLDTSSYSVGYVASWANGDTDTIRETAANVLRAVHTLADALDPCQATEVASAVA